MSFTITSPIEGYNGRSTFGSVQVQFEDGQTSVDELSDGLRTWLEGHGYEVTGDTDQSGDGDGQGGDDPFDPSEHSVDDVIEHLEQADDEERTRVLAAEADGKARKTVAEWQPKAPEGGDGA